MISGSSPPHHCYREEFLHFLPAAAAPCTTQSAKDEEAAA